MSSRSRSRSPNSVDDKHRDRPPSPRHRRYPLVSRPRDFQENIPEEFLRKQIENIIFVITHSETCSTFSSASSAVRDKRDNGNFQTKFDTIFTCDLGMFTSTMSCRYNKIIETILDSTFPNTGNDLLKRMYQNIGKVGKIFRDTTNIRVKRAGSYVTDLDTFCGGTTPSTTIDDGIFLYNIADELPIGPIQLKNIARNMFQWTYPKIVYKYKEDGTPIMSASQNPFVITGKDKRTANVRLSDILGEGKGLQIYEKTRISPDNTVVIVVTCRAIKGQIDPFSFQSPSPSSSSHPSLPHPTIFDWSSVPYNGANSVSPERREHIIEVDGGRKTRRQPGRRRINSKMRGTMNSYYRRRVSRKRRTNK